MRKNFATSGCDHTGSKYSPSYTHVNCTLCGAIGTDTGWGIASQAWFDDVTTAKFYQQNGRIPDKPTVHKHEPQQSGRIAIVQDTRGRWFVRSVASSTEDATAGEMVYHCDKHLAGPFENLMDAARWVQP